MHRTACLCAVALSLLPLRPAQAAPEWVERLFPHTGAPDRMAHRLRRVDAVEIDVAGRKGAMVTVELRYPELDGRDTTARARIFLPPALNASPARRAPLVHNAGYEIDAGGAAGLLARGFVVSTPHAHPLNPLGRGVNLDRAILHAARALPFVDPLRVSIQGGSAGGWMTLMLAADAFPLVWAMPDVPPIHWGYNAAYIGEQQRLAAAPEGTTTPRMPVLLAVGGIAEQSRALYGMPFEHPAYLAVSPLAHLDTITAPTLVTFSTADMLVPIDQVSPRYVRKPDRSKFPAGFTTAMTNRFPGVRGRRALLEALRPGSFEVAVLPAPANPVLLPFGAPPSGPPAKAELPFRPGRTWNIVVIDEGPVEPAVGHFKYHWALDREPFRAWAEANGVQADQLTQAKLERLMKRVLGEAWRPFRFRPGGKNPEVAANVLDWPEAERQDVLLGLRAFAEDDLRAAWLAHLYDRLPRRLRAFGPRLGGEAPAGQRDWTSRVSDGTPAAVRRALEAALRTP